MNRLWLVLLLLFGWVIPAAAQEKVVPLKNGRTVWGILRKDEGCSAKETVPLWPHVMEDSGLRPRDHRHLRDDTPIIIKRYCNGQLRQDDKGLKQLANQAFNAAKLAQDQTQTILDQIREERAGIEAAIAAERKLHVWWILGSIAILLGLGLWVLVLWVQKKRDRARIADLLSKLNAATHAFEAKDAQIVWRDRKLTFLEGEMVRLQRELDAKPQFAPDTLTFAPEVKVEHMGREYVFKRVRNLNTCVLGYKCPAKTEGEECKVVLPTSEAAKLHMTAAHKDLGLFSWNRS